jgi:hypothetical protein
MEKLTTALILLIAIISSCSSDSELKKSVYIEDDQFPDLPEYSEWGYNTFGAYYDRQAFKSNDREVPIKVINKEGKTSFVFTGQKGSGYSYDDFTLTLTISDFNPLTYVDLLQLNNTTFDLTDSKYEVVFKNIENIDTTQIIAGQFQITKTQNLLVDKKAEEVILSGKFDFQALVEGLPITISNGRFDVGVGNDNFYKY